MDKNTIQLMAFNNSTWELMADNISIIGNFLGDHKNSPEISSLVVMSVKLIVSELLIRKDDYNKYPKMEYSEEDFVDMVIDAISSNPPSINKEIENERYIEDIRSIAWGYIKHRYDDIIKILSRTELEELSEEDIVIFMECLTVSWVECILRERETRILENSYTE